MTQSAQDFLNSVDGEISFFRSIMRARPVGIHRHFHVIQIRAGIHSDTGTWVPIDDIWAKLRTCYDLDALDTLEEHGDSDDLNNGKTPSPHPDENLAAHPHFKEEYSIPRTPSYEALLSARRMRDSVSVDTPPGSPEPARRKRKRTKSAKNRATGLVPGDSDSSLTDQSGDDQDPNTPQESQITGTDEAGTEAGQDEEMDVDSPEPAAPSKLQTKSKDTRSASNQKKSSTAASRTRSAATSNSKSKKRKR